MASPHLWTPSLEPRTVINSSRDVTTSEAAALDKEEEEYEAQLHAIKIKSKRAPIAGEYKMRNDYMDDEPIIADDSDDSEYDEGDDEEEEDDEEEDLDEEIEELDDEVDDDVEEGEESEYQYRNDNSTPILTSTTAPEELEFVVTTTTETLLPTTPNRNSNIPEHEIFHSMTGNYNIGIGSNSREEITFNNSREEISFNIEA